MARYPAPLSKLIAELGRLPAIGPKSAQKLAFHLLSCPEAEAFALAESILAARKELKPCSECFNLTDQDTCDICSDLARDEKILCVVQEASDILAIEKAKVFQGKYHVLHGLLSPQKNIGPQDIKITELITRLSKSLEIEEVLLAMSPTAEGEATALYLKRLIKPSGIKLTRIASGLPMGSNMEFVDELTLSKAITGRVEL